MTRIGLAYAAYVPQLVRAHREAADYVELPFERLRADRTCARIADEIPVILHCASLSVAGVVPASSQLVAAVRDAASQLRSPWIGEHLAFVTAPDSGGGDAAEPISVGYTVTPPFNETTLERVADAWHRYQAELGVPVILENPPQYFATPGSTMGQVEFIAALVERTGVRLLFDLTHFLITARNMGFAPRRAIAELPLDRVCEVHLSGLRTEMGVAWDDHGTVVPAEAYELLGIVLDRVQPEAITLEYNWPAAFEPDEVVDELRGLRQMTRSGVSRAG